MDLINHIFTSARHRNVFTIALLIVSFSFYSQNSKFDINDPRNPNCPCHKYQKLADEEYKRLNKNSNSGVGEVASTELIRNDRVRKTNTYHLIKSKRRNKNKRLINWRKKLTGKHWSFWKRVTDPTKCFKW